MRSSKGIIRGPSAAELPSWSVDLIGSTYQSPTHRILSAIERQKLEQEKSKRAPTEEEVRLKEWEDALIRREAAIEHLEDETLKHAEERGQQTGYEAGWNAAHNERVALLQAAKTLEDEFERFKSELSEKLLDLAVLVSKKVIGDTLTMNPDHTVELLKEVLETMQLHSKAVTLRANPNTIRVLTAQFGDQQMLGNLRMVEDPKQLEGGFFLQHPEGEIDVTLQTRWLRVIEALGRNTPLTPSDLNKPADKDPE